ncbi:hypothetical protein C8J55DRAFT_567794 [Lentinula edodes]|uniref:Uncharacterized protein n=1 Tax=Lentinula lateritia TaxID=40482 RepID=A0A9W8ZQ51_9AGAR|nr:hypothetical protein C8J55DRAFT_567794 [Lentinula edodes]
MLILTDSDANSNSQPVIGLCCRKRWKRSPRNHYTRWGKLQSIVLGLTINTTNTDLAIAGDAAKFFLGSHLDAMLLGNEPDLYTAHDQRPNVVNYTDCFT